MIKSVTCCFLACDGDKEISENLATRRSLMRVREGSRFCGINGGGGELIGVFSETMEVRIKTQ